MTSIGVRFQDDQLSEKMLPCLTVCPINAFKNQGFHFTIEEYYNQTYSMQEIFYENEKFNLSANSNYAIEEVNGIYTGRCYMVCPTKKMPMRDVLILYFWKFRDIKGFISQF